MTVTAAPMMKFTGFTGGHSRRMILIGSMPGMSSAAATWT